MIALAATAVAVAVAVVGRGWSGTATREKIMVKKFGQILNPASVI